MPGLVTDGNGACFYGRAQVSQNDFAGEMRRATMRSAIPTTSATNVAGSAQSGKSGGGGGHGVGASMHTFRVTISAIRMSGTDTRAATATHLIADASHCKP